MTTERPPDTILEISPQNSTNYYEMEEQDAKCCRICYESDNPNTMIAPCLCKSDLKWIHRKCLNEYRAFNITHSSFTKCTICNFDYIIEIEKNNRCCRSPHAIFRMRVAWDVIKILLCFCASLSFIACCWHHALRIQSIEDHRGQWEGRETWQEAFLYATVTLLIILGIVGIFHGCFYALCSKENSQYNNNNYYRGHNGCCNGPGCIYIGNVHSPTCGGGHGNCGNCGNSSSGNNDGVAIFLGIIAIFLIIVGIIYCVVVSCVLIGRISAKHYSKLNAKLMTREYVVKDLQKYSMDKILKMQDEQELVKQKENPTPSAPEEVEDNKTPKSKHCKTITIM